MTQDELPDKINDMDSDEMIEWLSETSDLEMPPAKERPILDLDNFEQVQAILDKFVTQTRSGEQVDQVVQEYVLANLARVAQGERAWRVGRGARKISEVDMRWRRCAIRLLVDSGVTQHEISDLLGVTERTIASLLSDAKRHQSKLADIVVYQNMEGLVILELKKKDFRGCCLTLDRIRPLT